MYTLGTVLYTSSEHVGYSLLQLQNPRAGCRNGHVAMRRILRVHSRGAQLKNQPPPRSSSKAPFLALLISFSGAAASTYSAGDSEPPTLQIPPKSRIGAMDYFSAFEAPSNLIICCNLQHWTLRQPLVFAHSHRRSSPLRGSGICSLPSLFPLGSEFCV